MEIDVLLQNTIDIILLIVLIIIIYVVVAMFIAIIRKILLRNAINKKQKTNVELFSKIIKYTLFLFIALYFLFKYLGNLESLGFGLGLMSAAIGFALQKPITGIAAWLMVIFRRPFEIGDRVSIGDVKGDVIDITISHIHLNETGGRINSEDNSGRVLMIPNSELFEVNIVNYTFDNDFILDEVVISVTYESDLDKAEKICLDCARKVLDIEFHTSKHPYARVFFKDSSIDIHIRYLVPARTVTKYGSDITKRIWHSFRKNKDLEFAYPHMDVVYKKK
jgi:small-conductance mechanosensitive channel